MPCCLPRLLLPLLLVPLVVARPPPSPPPLSVVVVFVHCPGCCDAAAMSTPVFAATWDWGLFEFYVVTVLCIEHERYVPELVMVNDGELAVFVCWWAAAETDFLLFPKGVRSVHWEAKARHSSSSKRFYATPKTMKGVLGFCGILTQFPVRVESSHSSCISDIDAAAKSLDAGTWNVSESVKAAVVFATPGWFSRFDVQSPVAVEKAYRAGPWNEAESEFEGVEDVCQAACGDSSSAAASKHVSSGSKVSCKALGEMKEEKRVQFFVKNGGTSSVVRSSSLDVVSDVLHLHADEYAVCGSRLIKMEHPHSERYWEWFECAGVATAPWWCRCVFGHSWSVGVQSVSRYAVLAC